MNPDRLLSIAALVLCVGLVAHAFSVEARLGSVKAELTASKAEVEAVRKELATESTIRKNTDDLLKLDLNRPPTNPGF